MRRYKYLKFHSAPTIWKSAVDTQFIVGCEPVVPYSEEAMKEVIEEYQLQKEEHRKMREGLSSETFSIASKTEPDKKYTVVRHINEEWECDCPGFAFRKYCSHIEQAKSLKNEE